MTADPQLSSLPGRPDATIVATDAFTLVKVKPAATLDGLVADIALYRERSGRPVRQVETASLDVPLLIGFSDPFDIAIGREPMPQDGFQSFTSGLTLQPVNITSAGRCACLQINFTPLGARRFFGLPMAELTETLVRLDDLEDRRLAELRQQLGNEPDWGRRLAMAERFLARRMMSEPARASATRWAYERILQSGGTARMAGLADKLGWSRKHLASRFHDDIGLAPKAVARIARFMRAQKLAMDGRNAGWAGIAADCGYADQAHLTREFRTLAGSTPAAWLAEKTAR